jgi:hypothetical protein
VPVADVCASFQEAVVDVLTAKAVRACTDTGVEHLLLGGGVAANSRLRALAQQRCDAAGISLRVPRPGLCTDNGAMVAALGSRWCPAGVRRARWTPAPKRLRRPRGRERLSLSSASPDRLVWPVPSRRSSDRGLAAAQGAGLPFATRRGRERHRRTHPGTAPVRPCRSPPPLYPPQHVPSSVLPCAAASRRGSHCASRTPLSPGGPSEPQRIATPSSDDADDDDRDRRRLACPAASS